MQPVIDQVKENLDAYMNCYEKIFTWSEELVIFMNGFVGSLGMELTLMNLRSILRAN